MPAPPEILGPLSVVERPGMYVRSETFDEVTAYIDGFNDARGREVLAGFREWLITKLGYADNYIWSALVVFLTFPSTKTRGSREIMGSEPANQLVAIRSLATLLAEYYRDRDEPEGLRQIFQSYEQWLRKQRWYGPHHRYWKEPGPPADLAD